MNKFTANILSVAYAASASQYAEGMAWYDVARATAERMAEQYDISTVQAAAVIAALSPQRLWKENLRIAELALTEYAAGLPLTSTHTKVQMTKVEVILAASRYDSMYSIEPLLGKGSPKTKSFFRNIVQPDNDTVTVDGHAANVALNGLTRVSITSLEEKLEGELYTNMSDAYREAAKVLNLAPFQVQAITWVVYRELGFTKKARAKKASK